MALLRAMNGVNPGKLFPVGDSAVLGRHPDCGIVLDVGAVSRQHARITKSGEDFLVEDLQSRNGTFVNGRRITTRTPLKDEDQILAGQSTFLVEFVKATGPSPRAPASAAAGPGFARTSYTAEPCDSGLTLCRGNLNEIQPADLALRLAGALPAALLVETPRLMFPFARNIIADTTRDGPAAVRPPSPSPMRRCAPSAPVICKRSRGASNLPKARTASPNWHRTRAVACSSISPIQENWR